MIGDPHSQLVPTSPSWSQLAPRILAFSCQGVGVYRIQEICSCCCQHFKNMWWWPWCVPIQKPKQATCPKCFTQFMAIASADWWGVSHIIQLDKATNHGPAPTVFPSWETEAVQKLWVLCHYGGMHCVQQNLKPKQAPSRCWDSMPQVDSGSCKLHGRHNENWWLTALSTCIRGLTGQSVA